jgi:hypothetical protein
VTGQEPDCGTAKEDVARMAAEIYLSYVSSGAVEVGDEAVWLQRSIHEAIQKSDAVGRSH